MICTSISNKGYWHQEIKLPQVSPLSLKFLNPTKLFEVKRAVFPQSLELVAKLLLRMPLFAELAGSGDIAVMTLSFDAL